MSPTKYLPHAVFVIGFVVLLTALVPESPSPLSVETTVAIGLVLAVLGGAWYEAQRRSDEENVLAHLLGPLGYALYGNDPPETRKDWVAQVGGLVGLLLIFASSGQSSLSGPLQTGLVVVGMVLLLGAAYWNKHGRAVQSYDERQLRIRYRAAYVALWVIGLLLGVIILLGNAMLRPEGERGVLSIALVLAAAVPLFTGLLAFKIAEGYYEQQM